MTSPAPPTLYIADPLDETLTTRLVDLNGTWLGVIDGTFDIGELAQDVSWVGDVQARVHHPPPTMSMRLFLKKHAAVRNELATVYALNAALDSPGVMVMGWGGFAEVEYADFYRSPLTRLFRAEERNLWHILGLLKDPDGLPVSIIRAPARRLAIRNASDNLVVLSPLIEGASAGGVPDAWDWGDGSTIAGHAFSWRYRAYQFRMTVAGTTDGLEQVVPIGVQDGSIAYTFSFEVAGSWTGTLPSIRAEIDWLNAGDSQIGSTVVGALSTLLFAPAFGFAGPWVSGVAPATAVKARVRMVVSRPASNPEPTYYLRAPQLRLGAGTVPYRVEVQAVSNVDKRAWVYSPGNTDSPVQWRVTPDSGAAVERISMARRSGQTDVAEYARIAQGLFVDAVLGTGAAIVTDAAATSGDAVEVTHTAGLTSSIRVNVPQTSASALEGRHTLWVAMRLELAGTPSYQVRWGTGDVAALPYPAELIPADVSDPTEAPYVSVPLADVVIPHGATGLYFEILSTEPGLKSTFLDQWWLTPASSPMIARIPGIALPGQTFSREWLGADLVVPDSSIGTFGSGTLLDSGDLLLVPDAPDQAAGTTPVTGFDFEDVRHQLVADLNTFNDNGLVRKLGEYRLHDLTTDTQVALASIYSVKGQRWRERKMVLKFTPTVGHLYTAYVISNVSDTPSSNLHVRRLLDTFTPAIDGTDKVAAMDGDSRLAYVLEGGENAGPLDLDPPFMDAVPNLAMVRIELGDAAPSGWDAVFPFPVQAHVASRGAMLGASVIPRQK